MAISTVTSSSATALQASSLKLEDFMKILLTQLTFQDPLKPVDNQQFMAQMAQFTSLEQTQQLNDKMGLLLTNQAALQSVGLIGRTVDVTLASGATASGTVNRLSFGGESPTLSINTGGSTLVDISLSQITAVH
jgi:flagellar basal-body rod modification protein FlgD